MSDNVNIRGRVENGSPQNDNAFTGNIDADSGNTFRIEDTPPIVEGVQITDEGIIADNAYFRPVKRYEWSPQKDITAYELALCMPIISHVNTIHDPEPIIKGLPEEAQRHFKEL